MRDIFIPNQNQIEFVIKLHILKKVKPKNKEVGMILHILSYKEDKKSKKLDAVCLEFGIFVEGETKEEIANKFNIISNDILNDYTQKEKKMLKSSGMNDFWAVYREWEYNKAVANIKKDIQLFQNFMHMKEQIEQKNNKINQLEKQINSKQTIPVLNLNHSKDFNKILSTTKSEYEAFYVQDFTDKKNMLVGGNKN